MVFGCFGSSSSKKKEPASDGVIPDGSSPDAKSGRKRSRFSFFGGAGKDGGGAALDEVDIQLEARKSLLRQENLAAERRRLDVVADFFAACALDYGQIREQEGAT